MSEVKVLDMDAEVRHYKTLLTNANNTIAQLREESKRDRIFWNEMERVVASLNEVLNGGRKLSEFVQMRNPEKMKWRWQVFVGCVRSIDRLFEQRTRERLEHKDNSQSE